MKSGPNHILVKIKATFDDEFVTDSGLKLYKDVTFDEEWHLTSSGEVVAIPDALNRNHQLLINSESGKPYTAADIEPDVQVGDTIHFHYMANMPEHRIMLEDGLHLRVPYGYVFCAIRDEEILPIGSYTFIEEIEEREDLGMLINPFSKKRMDAGIIRHIGKPLKGEELPWTGEREVCLGDKVVFTTDVEQRETVLGDEYIIIYQQDILGLWT